MPGIFGESTCPQEEDMKRNQIDTDLGAAIKEGHHTKQYDTKAARKGSSYITADAQLLHTQPKNTEYT